MDEQNFISIYILQLVNIYFEHFLKDLGMIALKMLSKDNQVLMEKKIFEFAQKFIDNVHLINEAMRHSLTN